MKLLTKKHAIAACLTGLVLPAAFIVFVYLITAASEPYRAAEAFVATNEIVRERVGPVVSVRLGFGKIKFTYSSRSGNARMPLVVRGQAKEGVVYATLTKEQGAWKVTSATLDLQDGSTRLTP